MSTVAIIGAGDIGGACAYALATGGHARRVILIDEKAAAGKALDLLQSGPICQFTTRVEGAPGLEAAITADVCVIADRMGIPPEEWTGEAGLTLLQRVSQLASKAVLVLAGSKAGDLMRPAVVELGLPAARLLGSAPAALASAARAITALEAGGSATDVALTLAGSAREFVIPWSQASISGARATGVLSQASLARVEARVARLWPLGPEVLGVAAARLTEAVLTTSRRTQVAFTVVDGLLGLRREVAALPLLVGPRGLTALRLPPLDTREETALITALRR